MGACGSDLGFGLEHGCDGAARSGRPDARDLAISQNPRLIAPVLSERLSEVLASLKGKDLTLLMSQSDMNHSRGLIDVEFTIERGANV